LSFALILFHLGEAWAVFDDHGERGAAHGFAPCGMGGIVAAPPERGTVALAPAMYTGI